MSKQRRARFTFLLDADLKREFESACTEQDITPSQLMRQMIKAMLAAQATTPQRVGDGSGRRLR